MFYRHAQKAASNRLTHEETCHRAQANPAYPATLTGQTRPPGDQPHRRRVCGLNPEAQSFIVRQPEWLKAMTSDLLLPR
jgi:hypothetical protein